MAAEAGGDPEPVVERVDDRLAVGRHVVGAGGDDRERDELQRRQQQLELLVDAAAPPVLLGRWVAFAAQIAREHTPVRELLRREPAIDRDHERLEQALPDRLAQEERARLLDDRQVEAERRNERARLRAGRDDDGIRLTRAPDASSSRQPAPSRAIATHVRRARLRRRGDDPRRERLDDRLRPGEVPVLGAPGRAEHAGRVETRHDLRRLARREEPRRNAELVLNREPRLEPRERLLLVGEEEVAARVEPLAEVAVEAIRLLRHQAVRARPPLLPHAAGLDPDAPEPMPVRSYTVTGPRPRSSR